MKKKKKSQKSTVPAIPQLSLDALDDVQKIERYTRQQLRANAYIQVIYNSEKQSASCELALSRSIEDSDRLLRISSITFHEKWIIQLQGDAIDKSGIGMIPDRIWP